MPIDREAALTRAEKCLRQGRLDGAIEEYVRLVDDQPRDWGLVNTLGDLYVRVGDAARAYGQFIRVADFYFEEGFFARASAVYKKALKLQEQDDHALSQLAEIASRQELFADAKIFLRQLARLRRDRGDRAAALSCLLRLGSLDRSAEALDALVEAADLDPADVALRARIARECLASGQPERARAFLTADTAGDDPQLLLAVAVTELEAERDEAARALLTRVITLAPEHDGSILDLAAGLAQRGSLDRAYACVDIVVDASLMQGDMPRAVTSLQSFLRQGTHLPALVKLVEICVDAGLDAPMREAQAMLADVYLETGRAAEARAISEDLLASDPASQAHLDRLRRVLVTIGVANVDATLAEYLEPDPFEAELEADAPEKPSAVEAEASVPAPDPGPAVSDPPDSVPPASEPPAIVPPVTEPPETLPPVSARFETVPPASDPPASVAPKGSGKVAEAGPLEIDLSDALGELAWRLETPGPAAAPVPDLDDVFAQMRTAAERDQQTSDAVARYERALADIGGGREDEAIAGLRAAARVPSLRFRAAGHLARLYLGRGDLPEGINWLEQAAEAPAPTPDEGFAVLFDLAAALEASGEVSRALAVLMELDSAAGGYRDIRAHIDRLSRARVNEDRR